MEKVIVGMSGGVDSSVAAYLLTKRGYEVRGVSFLMWEAESSAPPACCSLKTTEEASRTANSLGIQHVTIDARNDFREKVVEPFIKAYQSGLTPNPCILCNRFIKFPFLIGEAEKRGAMYISTGHYAKVEGLGSVGPENESEHLAGSSSASPVCLKKGVDPKKDQSYVLYALRQEELRRLLLPLGCYRKSDVRKMAKDLGLSAAMRPESQEICFVGEKDYISFIEEFSSVRTEPGPIVDPDGNIIGTHKGVFGYTIGQRKGLGISSPRPLYVIDTDIRNNTIYVGPRDAAREREFLVGELNWIMTPTAREFTAAVKVRSTMREEPAKITLLGGSSSDSSFIPHPSSFVTVRVVFDEPQWAPAPGQSAVFYKDDAVIGGGIIRKQD
jgi:tRNA-specific 2-thiouridylase